MLLIPNATNNCTKSAKLFTCKLLSYVCCMRPCARNCNKSFPVNNFADFPDVVRLKKKKKKIPFSRWWRLKLATFPIGQAPVTVSTVLMPYTYLLPNYRHPFACMTCIAINIHIELFICHSIMAFMPLRRTRICCRNFPL